MIFALLCMISIAGCGVEEDEEAGLGGYVCPDGRLVNSEELCQREDKFEVSNQDSAQLEPDPVEVHDTEQRVSSVEEAKQAFEEYKQANSYTYDYISGEPYKEEGGKDIYRIKYRYYEKSGGTRYVLVDSTGRVFYELPLG